MALPDLLDAERFGFKQRVDAMSKEQRREIAKWLASQIRQANDSFQLIDNAKCRRQSPEIDAVIESDIASSDLNQRYANIASDRLKSIVAQCEIEGLQASVRGTKQQSS